MILKERERLRGRKRRKESEGGRKRGRKEGKEKRKEEGKKEKGKAGTTKANIAVDKFQQARKTFNSRLL